MGYNMKHIKLSKYNKLSPSESCLRVASLLIKEHISPDDISPNYVAEFAFNRGIGLTTDDVVYISNNVDKYLIKGV